MVSPASPAIDGDLFDEELFEDQIGRRVAGFDEDDEDEEVDDGSTSVAEGLREEEDIDEETFSSTRQKLEVSEARITWLRLVSLCREQRKSTD